MFEALIHENVKSKICLIEIIYPGKTEFFHLTLFGTMDYEFFNPE
jgi:hypothetical protein